MYEIEVDHILHRIIQTFYWFGIWRNEEKPHMRLLFLLTHILFFIFILTCGRFDYRVTPILYHLWSLFYGSAFDEALNFLLKLNMLNEALPVVVYSH